MYSYVWHSTHKSTCSVTKRYQLTYMYIYTTSLLEQASGLTTKLIHRSNTALYDWVRVTNVGYDSTSVHISRSSPKHNEHDEKENAVERGHLIRQVLTLVNVQINATCTGAAALVNATVSFWFYCVNNNHLDQCSHFHGSHLRNDLIPAPPPPRVLTWVVTGIFF